MHCSDREENSLHIREMHKLSSTRHCQLQANCRSTADCCQCVYVRAKLSALWVAVVSQSVRMSGSNVRNDRSITVTSTFARRRWSTLERLSHRSEVNVLQREDKFTCLTSTLAMYCVTKAGYQLISRSAITPITRSRTVEPHWITINYTSKVKQQLNAVGMIARHDICFFLDILDVA